jgi:hypothetical protein
MSIIEGSSKILICQNTFEETVGASEGADFDSPMLSGGVLFKDARDLKSGRLGK